MVTEIHGSTTAGYVLAEFFFLVGDRLKSWSSTFLISAKPIIIGGLLFCVS